MSRRPPTPDAAEPCSPGRTRTPHIVVRLPRCPACGSTHLNVYKRIRKAGFKVHYAKCRNCSANVNLDIL